MKKKSVMPCLLGGMIALLAVHSSNVKAAEMPVTEEVGIASGSTYEYLNIYEARREIHISDQNRPAYRFPVPLLQVQVLAANMRRQAEI